MRGRAAILATASSVSLVLSALAQDGGTPPDAPPPVVTPEPAPGTAGSVLDGVAIPEGVVGTIVWEEGDGEECSTYHGRRSCNGPRRVPRLVGDAITRAEDLELTNHTRVARIAITRAPEAAWVAAAGTSTASDILWPLDGGRFWRPWGSVRSIRRTKRGGISRTGRRRHHEGVDLGAAEGTRIFAANDGLVVYSWNGMSGYGNVVAIVHPDASLTMYAHCSATFVVAGQMVTRGQVIAAVGETGLAHGAHVHFELRIDGESHDPEPRFVGRPDHDDGAEPPPDDPDAEGDSVEVAPEAVEVIPAD